MGAFENFKEQARNIVNLSGHIDTDAAEASIRSNIYFRGPNAWILAFSMVIASVGLNINSIPVIIGAMLISPLMGPIFGIGLGLGISDITLLKESGKNLLIMVSISLTASIIYFLITPLNLTNPTELLARTNPTIYDVLIALFGGFAGIFEQSRKNKGTVFEGVAIATALMPPLCTAGFGIATGNLRYFIGALYLFVINCIFITLATYATVKYLNFKKTEYADVNTGRKTRNIVTFTIILFIIPSIWSAVTMVQQNNFEGRAKQFVETYESIGNSFIYDHKISHTDGSKIELFITGEPLGDNSRQFLISKAQDFDIKEGEIIINEHTTAKDENPSELIKSIYKRTDEQVETLSKENAALKEEVRRMAELELPYLQLAKEVQSTYPEVTEVTLSRGASACADSNETASCIVAVIKSSQPLAAESMERLKNWMKVRLGTDRLMLYNDHDIQVCDSIKVERPGSTSTD